MSSPSNKYVYNPNPPHISFAKTVIAGGGAGIAEILVMYPLDVVKTRLQLQVTSAKQGQAVLYKSVGSCFTHIVKTEGVGRLYRGIASPILAEAPKRAVKFSLNEQYKQLFAPLPFPLLRSFCAGAAAGMTEAFINCPFEVVKVRMQALQSVSPYKSTLDAAIQISKHEGLRGIYRGLVPQLYRNGVWNGVYFAVIFKLKAVLWIPESKNSELFRNFIAGFIGGSLATTANTPLDVVKSRMQNVKSTDTEWRTVSGAIAKIYREEGGIKALWKGYVPRLYRLGPGGGIMIVAFDWISNLLS